MNKELDIYPTKRLELLIYNTLVLINQGIPYIYVFLDKILPQIKERMGIMPIIQENQTQKIH